VTYRRDGQPPKEGGRPLLTMMAMDRVSRRQRSASSTHASHSSVVAEFRYLGPESQGPEMSPYVF